MAAVADRKPATPVLATSPVSAISRGPYSTKRQSVSKPWFPWFRRSLPPKSFDLYWPEDKGTYPVIVFFSGTALANTSYSDLLDQLASHGYVVVAPQLYSFLPPQGNQEVNDAAKLLNWLPNDGGLQPNLPDDVLADLTHVALMGHSRGGLIAFALAQGGYATKPQLSLKISALVGIDPVAGLSRFQGQLTPPILSHETFSFTIPVTVIGTGLGGVTQCVQPCAPEGLNHEQFFIRCRSSDRAHFDAKEYGHMDVLDDNPRDGKSWAMSKKLCTNGKKPRDPMRKCVAWISAAFLKAYFDGVWDDFKAILKDPCLAPITLDQVEFVPAPAKV